MLVYISLAKTAEAHQKVHQKCIHPWWIGFGVSVIFLLCFNNTFFYISMTFLPLMSCLFFSYWLGLSLLVPTQHALLQEAIDKPNTYISKSSNTRRKFIIFHCLCLVMHCWLSRTHYIILVCHRMTSILSRLYLLLYTGYSKLSGRTFT